MRRNDRRLGTKSREQRRRVTDATVNALMQLFDIKELRLGLLNVTVMINWLPNQDCFMDAVADL